MAWRPQCSWRSCPQTGLGGSRYCIILVTRESPSYLQRLLFGMESSHNKSIFDPTDSLWPQSPCSYQGNRDTVGRQSLFHKTSRRAVHVGPPSLAPKPWAVESRLKLALGASHVISPDLSLS